MKYSIITQTMDLIKAVAKPKQHLKKRLSGIFQMLDKQKIG